jgi:ribosome biogenesis GTPase A
MDVVIEIRDARIPLSTSHPKVNAFGDCSYLSVQKQQLEMLLSHAGYDQMDSWLGNRRRIIVLNREDMISTEDRNAWATYFANQGTKVVFANGQLGMVRIASFSFGS